MVKAECDPGPAACGAAVIYLHHKMMFQRQMEGKHVKIQKPGRFGFRT